MKEKILSIASDLREGFTTTNEAKKQLLNLLSNETLIRKKYIEYNYKPERY